MNGDVSPTNGATGSYVDGTTFSFLRRERPHLVFADDGFTIVGLTTGITYNDSTTKGNDACFTFFQPVRACTSEKKLYIYSLYKRKEIIYSAKVNTINNASFGRVFPVSRLDLQQNNCPPANASYPLITAAIAILLYILWPWVYREW